MFSRILSLFPAGNRQFPLRYLRMIASIKDRMTLAKNRYMLAHPTYTAGIEFLKYVCASFELSTLDQYKNDVDRYTEALRGATATIRNFVDPVYTNSIAGGRFVGKIAGVAPYEVLLNSECLDPLNTYPFDKDWSEWQNLRGVRVLYHDSLELPEDFAKSTFIFKNSKPNYLVIAVDVVILRFKFYKYTKYCKESGIQPDLLYFLKEFELSKFFDDLIDIWTLNLMMRVFSMQTDTVDNILEDVTMPIRFCTKNMLTQGIEGMIEFADLLRQGSIRPQEFLATRWFDDRNIIDMINENCIKWTQIEPGTRHLWLRTIRDIPYFALILTIVRMFPSTPFKESVETRCKEMWNTQIRLANLPNTVLQPALGNFVRGWQAKLEKMLNGGEAELPFSQKTT